MRITVLNLDLLLFLPVKGVPDEWLAAEKIVERLAGEDKASQSSLLDLLRYEDISAEDIVSHDLAADDAAKNFARVDANLELEVSCKWCSQPFAFFLEDLKHLQCNLEDIVALDYCVIQGSSILGNLTGVAHDHVGFAHRV